jgi:hypothetical protein
MYPSEIQLVGNAKPWREVGIFLTCLFTRTLLVTFSQGGCQIWVIQFLKFFSTISKKYSSFLKVFSSAADEADKRRVAGMLQFSLGLIIGISLGVFIMCLMIMAGRGPEPPVDEKIEAPDGEPRITRLQPEECQEPDEMVKRRSQEPAYANSPIV